MAEDKQNNSQTIKNKDNSLAQIKKNSDVASAIDDTKKWAPNQISPQLDKFENSLIRKKVFKE